MTKLEALKKTVYVLENNLVKYRWTDSNSCNCGVLAQCSLGLNVEELSSIIYSNIHHSFEPSIALGPWQKSAIKASECLKSGLPISKVFQDLFALGFTKDEIYSLEDLSDNSILKVSLSDRSSKPHVILYLKAWIEKLEKEQPIEVIEKTIYRTVLVTIDEKVKELIDINPILN